MSEALPELLDPRRAVALNARFEGLLPLSGLNRLRPLLASTEGSAAYSLDCGVDSQGRAVISGKVEATLDLTCQRCNAVLSLPVASEYTLALVEGIDESAALPDDYDPLLVSDQLMRSTDLVEDELILCIPAIPRHPLGSCEAPRPESLVCSGGCKDTASTDKTKRPNPFAELLDLKIDLEGTRKRDEDK
jgi:uncharacterized protein